MGLHKEHMDMISPDFFQAKRNPARALLRPRRECRQITDASHPLSRQDHPAAHAAVRPQPHIPETDFWNFRHPQNNSSDLRQTLSFRFLPPRVIRRVLHHFHAMAAQHIFLPLTGIRRHVYCYLISMAALAIPILNPRFPVEPTWILYWLKNSRHFRKQVQNNLLPQ